MEESPGSPVVKNLPCSAQDTNSLPGWGTKVSHAAEQLTRVPQLSPDAGKNKKK